ncbi:MAG TPA: efflux RND transporter periplasmic adaptor subunit [Candidatus Elarobacter sp.]|jgi:HlyD family secretion protein|nr:efflux RND transporter periplasmic adaptor subunit [Candidatus Elarobacter sp.]
MRRPSFALPVLALPALAALALSGCAAHAATTNAPAATPVTLAIAAAPATRAAYSGPGTIAPQRTYRIAFEVPGRVVAVNADVGDRVAAGTMLAAIDGSDYSAQARAADARALEASATAMKARNGARAQERFAADQAVTAARAQLDRALAAQRLADASRARFDALYASGDVAALQHDQSVAGARDADAAVNAARAQLAQAEAQRSLVRDGTRSEDLVAASAQASAASASADLARVTLGKTRIAAPADAYVQERNVEPGSDAQPGAVAFVLVDARDPDVLVNVPEARLDNVAPGTAAIVHVNGRAYRGHVTRVEPSADPASRTAQVRVRVAGLRARSGGIVDVALGAVRGGGDAGIPLASVITDPAGGSSVLVYDAATQTAAKRVVHVVSGDADRALVAGIAPGTRVVRAGAALVKPGAPLTVVPE